MIVACLIVSCVGLSVAIAACGFALAAWMNSGESEALKTLARTCRILTDCIAIPPEDQIRRIEAERNGDGPPAFDRTSAIMKLIQSHDRGVRDDMRYETNAIGIGGGADPG